MSAFRRTAGLVAASLLAATAATQPIGWVSGAAGAESGATILATQNGYTILAGEGQNNLMVATVDDNDVLINDKALSSFAEIPAQCRPYSPAEGVGVACPLARHTVLEFDLLDGDDWLEAWTLPRSVDLRVQVGPGENIVEAGAGDDRVVGGDGRDTLYGGPGEDVVEGGPGNDYVRGHGGDDVVLGGPGLNFLIGDGGDDLLRGGADLDFALGDAGDDRVYGGGGADSVEGGRGFDVVSGDLGDDDVTGGSDPDRLYGGGGSDVLHARDAGKDDLDCGAGPDVARVDEGGVDRAEASCEKVAPPKP